MDINDFINAVDEKDYVKAEPMFKDMMQDRVQTELDSQKIAVADAYWNKIETGSDALEPAVEPEEIETVEVDTEET